MVAAGLEPAVVHTSRLVRVIRSAEIALDLRAKGCVLVVAHGQLAGTAEAPGEIAELNIPTGLPKAFELDRDLSVLSAAYLGNPAEIAARSELVAEQVRRG